MKYKAGTGKTVPAPSFTVKIVQNIEVKVNFVLCGVSYLHISKAVKIFPPIVSLKSGISAHSLDVSLKAPVSIDFYTTI